MSNVSQDLLLSDPRQAVIAPSILLELRRSDVDYSSYLTFLVQDIALGRTPLEWGDHLATDGILSVAKECWVAAGVPQPMVDEKYQAAKESWEGRTARYVQEIQGLSLEYKGRLAHDQREQVESLLREAKHQAEQDWYDLATETLGEARTILGQALTAMGEEREGERAQLLRSIDDLWQRLADPDSFPPGTEDEKALNRLLNAARQILEQPGWNAKQIHRIVNVAQALCDGSTLDLRAVANALGEKYEEPKAFPLIARERSDTAKATIEALQEAARVEPIDAQQRQRQEQSERVHRSAKQQRISKGFIRAERMFKEALQLWPGNEAAAKNLASMLQQLGRTEDAIDVLKQGVEHAQERLPFYNLLTNFCTDAGRFDEARDYAQKALRLSGDARAEIGVLTSLVTLEVKVGNIAQAIEYCDTILRLNPRHEHFRKERERLRAMLAGQVAVPTESRVEPALEFVPEPAIHVTALLAEDLERCELTKISPAILKTSDPNKLVERAERLSRTGGEWNPQQPKERADYFLQAAKIVLLAFGTREIKDPIARNLQQYLNKYTGAMGDYFLSRGQMDSARAYFLEHVRLFKDNLPSFTLYRIANYFQTFVPREEDMGILVRRRIPSSTRSVVTVLNRALDVVQPGERLDLGRGLVEIACANRIIYEIVLRELKSQPSFASRLFDLLQNVVREYSVHTITEATRDLFSQVVQHRRVSIERQEDYLRRIIEAASDRRRLSEADALLQELTNFQVEWNSTDRSLFVRVREIGREGVRYSQESRFEDKDYLANSVSISAERFLRLLDDAPTYLGRAYFSRIVYRFRRLVEEEHRKLRLVSLPDLVPTIVKTAWLIANEQRECHIEITNRGESGAQDVSVRILESETGDYATDSRSYAVPGGSIYARPHSVTVAIPISLQREAASKDAVDLRVKLEYYDRESRKKETDSIRLRLSLRDEVPFTPIDNPYRTGLPVREREMFVGRDQFVEELVREMTRHERTSAVVIYGQKRSGKTSILHHIELNVPDWAMPVYFSMQTVLMEEDIVPGMFYLIADEIARKCREKGIGDEIGSLTWEQLTSPPGPSLQFRMYLDRIRQSPGVRLILLIDEFTELAVRIDEGKIDRSVMKYLKSLIEQGFFSCVLSGIDTMPQVLKRYSNELAVSDPRLVGYLNHDPAAELIERPILLPDNRSRFISKQVVDEIIRLTAGSPYYIQFVCHRLVEYLNRTQNPTATGADVDRVVAEMTQGSTRLDPFTKFDNLFRYKEDETRDTRETSLEGLFLYLLADETRTRLFAPFSAVRQRASFVDEAELLTIADQLEERLIIDRAHGPVRQYRIIVDLFRRWINANRPMDSEALNAFRAKLERMVA